MGAFHSALNTTIDAPKQKSKWSAPKWLCTLAIYHLGIAAYSAGRRGWFVRMAPVAICKLPRLMRMREPRITTP
jgi:hypothetical protein